MLVEERLRSHILGVCVCVYVKGSGLLVGSVFICSSKNQNVVPCLLNKDIVIEQLAYVGTLINNCPVCRHIHHAP